jgi:hypothetical protein
VHGRASQHWKLIANAWWRQTRRSDLAREGVDKLAFVNGDSSSLKAVGIGS